MRRRRYRQRLRRYQLRLVAALAGGLLVGLLVACGAPDAALVAPQPIAPPAADAAAGAPLDAGARDAERSSAATPPPDEPAAYLEHVAVLREANPKTDQGVARLVAAFRGVRSAADPRAAEDLARYLESQPAPRFRVQAALALAELGDRRAAEHLAWRLGQDTMALYKDVPELRRDDSERIAAARYLADLLWLDPGDADLARLSEKAALAWLSGQPSPHANGLRVLSLTASSAAVAHLRRAADPSASLPKAGAQPPLPMAFATAQSGLRYLGASTRRAGAVDEPTVKLLRKQLARRPKDFDGTMDGITSGGNAILGMTLRALATGAAQGMAETRDSRFAGDLMAFVEDPKTNEQARLEACFALAAVGTEAQIAALPAKVLSPRNTGPAGDVERLCYLETMGRRSAGERGVDLLPLLGRKPDEAKVAARALGRNGVVAAARPKLTAALDVPDTAVAAGLALLLGGDERDAALVGAKLGASEELPLAYIGSFDVLLEADLERGNLARWVKNARASGTAWAPTLLSREISSRELDAGPQTLTRVRLRKRLHDAALGADAAKRADALLVLEALGERGVLGALRQPR